MKEILICYYSRSGTTEDMAGKIAKGVRECSVEANVEVKKVEETDADELLNYDALVFGSPTYYGLPAAELKELIDESVAHHGDLDGVVGGAFASSANTGGGNETTIIGLLEALLIHGMVIQGDPEGDHYGPVVVGDPKEEEIEQCKRYGKRIAELTEKVRG